MQKKKLKSPHLSVTKEILLNFAGVKKDLIEYVCNLRHLNKINFFQEQEFQFIIQII